MHERSKKGGGGIAEKGKILRTHLHTREKNYIAKKTY